MMHTLKKNKAVHMELGTGKDIPTQSNMFSTVCRALYLLVRKCFIYKVHFYVTEQSLMSSHETIFPNTFQVSTKKVF